MLRNRATSAKALALLLLASCGLTLPAAAQDDPVGIDSLCGPSALSIVAADQGEPLEEAAALDDLLLKFVTAIESADDIVSIYGLKPPAPGAVIMVDAPGGRYFRSVGVADVTTCAPLQPDSPFAIGSNTKMFTAAVIFQLAEEGLLSLDDFVADYLPDEIALFPGAESATVEMLLSHTSGLPDYLNSSDPLSIGVLDMDPSSGGLEQGYTPEELVRNAANNSPLLFAPGAEGMWSYSNTGYIMLGQIIEQVSGKPYAQNVAERILEPLGLDSTVVVAEFADDIVNMPSGYVVSPFTYDTSGWNYTQAWSAGNIVSTPDDMAVFLRALYSGDLFQDADTLAAMLAPAAEGAIGFSDSKYYMHGGNYLDGFLGHGGQTLGMESDVGFDPETGVVIVTWANSSEALSAHGVYHVGDILGLTQSYDEAYRQLRQ